MDLTLPLGSEGDKGSWQVTQIHKNMGCSSGSPARTDHRQLRDKHRPTAPRQQRLADISALPMPSPDRCGSDEVTGHERTGRGWGASRCHPDHEEIPPHPLQMAERSLLTSATRRSLPYSLSPSPLQAAKPDEKGGNPVAPRTFQLQHKAPTLYWGRAELPAHGPGCCRNSPGHPGFWKIFFRSVLKLPVLFHRSRTRVDRS